MEGIHRERTNLTFRFWALEGRAGSMVILLIEEILNQLVFPVVYKVLYIPGFAGFLPSTVGGRDW